MPVRAARRDEAGDIAELWAELVAYHGELDADLPRPVPDGMERYGYSILEHLERPDAAVYVVVDGQGVVVGYALVIAIDTVPETFVRRRVGFLADIYVQPHARRNGYGRALVGAVTDWCTEQGLTALEWEVAAENTAGQDFWRALRGRDLMLRMRMNLEEEE